MHKFLARVRKKAKEKRGAEAEELDSGWADVVSLIFVGTGALLFMALLTYDPLDLPGWVPFGITDKPHSPAHNFAGLIGAILAGMCYFALGAAAYLMPAGLAWIGSARLLLRFNVSRRAIFGYIILCLTGACLLHAQAWWLLDWPARYNIMSPGGLVGRGLGGSVIIKIAGQGGGIIILGTLYFIGVTMLTGWHPLHFIRAVFDGIENWWRRAFERRANGEPMFPLIAFLGRIFPAAQEGAPVGTGGWRGFSAGSGGSGLAGRLGRVVGGSKRPAKAEGGSLEQAELDLAAEAAAAAAKKKRGAKSASAAASSEEVDQAAGADAGELTAAADPALDTVADAPKPEGDQAAGAAAGEDADAAGDEDFNPPPRIIDGTQRKPKPTLEEVMGARAAATEHRPPANVDFKDYVLPPIDMLKWDEAEAAPADADALIGLQNTIVRTLGTFGITVTPGDITRGPTITRYEIYPSDGLRVSRIATLEADIARATKAERINILAPIPGKDTVGIEIANSERVTVHLRELLEDPEFSHGKSKIPLALGKDVYGNTIIADLSQMPHLLVAGSTGSGKSVCINSIVASLLFQFTPDQLRFIMIDPKVVEMQNYNKLPHLVVPVVTDPKKVLLALRWVVNEMERRYRMFAKTGSRNFDTFNKKQKAKREREEQLAAERRAERENAAPMDDPFEEADDDEDEDTIGNSLARALAEAEAAGEDTGDLTAHHAAVEEEEEDASPWARRSAALDDEEDEIPDSLPYIVVIIDELADLMQTAPADVESAIARITQMARAAGIHLIVATQTPRADVITGVIKANIPSRIAFQVASALDSRVILDTKGAERLVGKGDMLYLPPGSAQLIRSQGAFVEDGEIENLVDFCANQAEPNFHPDVHESINGGGEFDEEVSDEDEELLEKVIEVLRQEGKCSTSMIQRRLRLGYTRAARMVDILEMRGVVGPGEGAKPREILVELGDGF